MNSLLLWIGGLLVAVLGLMFAVPLAINWNDYRGTFEEEASRILGREVRVRGNVNLRLLPSPYVRFEGVRISDAGAALGEPFFRAEAFTLWLSPAPLLRGAIEASELELDRPVLRLAVDTEGRGNWQALKFSAGAMPFMPSDVVLQQVRIQNGIVSLKMPGTPEPLALSGIEGEIAALSIDGPYRFRGMVDWYGSRRELRIGTSQRESDGKLRYKASVRVPDSGNTYSVDGTLSELTAKARHTGTVTAKLPLVSFFGGIMAAESHARAARGTDIIDLKASLEGDIDGAKLTDLAFAFEQDGKPQLMNGELTANWRNGLRMETRLASRWLDLDQIIGKEPRKGAPVDTVRRLIGQVSGMLPPDGSSLLTIDVDQVSLGGESLSAVRLALARAGGQTSIGELKAVLPGNARGELRGTLGAASTAAGPAAPADRSAAANAFEGSIVLRGPSQLRFAAWAGAEALLPALSEKDFGGMPDAPFSIDAKLKLLPESVVLSNAQIEMGSRQAALDLNWNWGAQPKLDISAEGRAIDVKVFAPGVLDLMQPDSAAPIAAASATRLAETGSAPLMRLADKIAAIERAVGSLTVKLKTGELTDGRTVVRDVDADVAVKGGALRMSSLRMTSAAGARLDLQGEITALRSKPAGTLRGWVSAGSREAVGSVTAMLPTGARAIAGGWLGQGQNTDLGFTLTLAGGESETVSLAAEGLVDAAHTVLDLKIDGGLAKWREAPITIALDVDGPTAAPLLRRLAGRAAGTTGNATYLDTVALQVRAAGASASAITTVARLDTSSTAGANSAEYSGRTTVRPDGGLDLAGVLTLDAPAGGDLLVLAGAGMRPMAGGASVRGKVDLERKGGITTFSARALEVGNSRVGGRIALSSRGDRTRLDGQLTADRLSIGGLMGLVLDGQVPAVRGADGEAASGGSASPWPDAPFSLGILQGSEGLIAISAPAAGLSPELEVGDAEIRVAFGPGRIDIQSLTGSALGGRFTARGTIEGAAAGAEISLEGRLTGAQLARLTRGQAATSTSGEANVVAAFASRGLSPRAAMAVATGKGEVEIRNGRVQGIAASLVEKAALAALEADDGVTRAALERIVASERNRSVAVLGNRKLPIEIADGAAKIGALEIGGPEANLRNMTTIDLGQLKVDSEWQILPRRPLPGTDRASTARREPLPAMTIVWTGPLGAIARAEPRLSVDSLERELSIRKLERDAERLEDLRRQDEERARTETERQKRMEAPAGDTSSPLPASAPVIQAPLPLGPAAVPQSPGSALPAASGSDATGPRVVRPPQSRPSRGDAKTLQDLMMGQQP